MCPDTLLIGPTVSLGRKVRGDRRGLEWGAENRYLTSDEHEAWPMQQAPGSPITYRIALGQQQGCKVPTLQMLPASDEPVNDENGRMAAAGGRGGTGGPTPATRMAVSLHQQAAGLG